MGCAARGLGGLARRLHGCRGGVAPPRGPARGPLLDQRTRGSMLYPAEVLGDPEPLGRGAGAPGRGLRGRQRGLADRAVAGLHRLRRRRSPAELRGRSCTCSPSSRTSRRHRSTAGRSPSSPLGVELHLFAGYGPLLHLRPSPRHPERRDPQDPRATPRMSGHEHAVVTPDGHELLVREWGASSGCPVIAHHGTPSCRLGRPGHEAGDGRTGVRLISFDRPGYGGSTPRPGGTPRRPRTTWRRSRMRSAWTASPSTESRAAVRTRWRVGRCSASASRASPYRAGGTGRRSRARLVR